MSAIRIVRATTENITVTFTDSDANPIDLTGATVFFTVKKKSDLSDSTDTDAIITKDITSHTDPTQGVTSIPLTVLDTDQEPDFYFYDLKVKDSSDNIMTTEMGNFNIVNNVTKRTS